MTRRVAPVLALAASIVGLAGGAPTIKPAYASSAPIVITNTNGIGVGIRTEPAMAAPKVGAIPEGRSPDYHCYVHAENVGGTTLWFYVTYGGATGWYTSYYDDVPLVWQNNIEGYYGIPRCGAQQATGGAPTDERINVTPGENISVAPAAIVYNRAAAVSWALEHAQDWQDPKYSGCTWFVSQALWAGWLPQTEKWNASGLRLPRLVPGTPAATAVTELIDYLQDKKYVETISITDRFATNAIPEAQPGDIIAYNWDGKGSFDHLAFVVDITGNSYPRVAEWGTVGFPDQSVNYQKRGWTWSVNSGAWLQAANPKIEASLLRFTLPDY